MPNLAWTLLITAALLVAGCLPQKLQASSDLPQGSPPAGIQATQATPILIGGVFCQTGVMAFADGPALRGAELAVTEINGHGGVLGRPLELAHLDCKSDANVAAEAARQLIAQGAVALIAPGTYYFGAEVSREAQKAGLVGLSTTASSSLYNSTVLGDKQFTLSMWNTTMGAAAAEFAYLSQGWKSAYILTNQSIDYTRSLSRYFSAHYQKIGGTVLAEDFYPEGETDFSAQISHIQALPQPPDILFIASAMPDLGNIIQALHNAGLEMPVLGGDSYDNPELFTALAGEGGAAVYFATHTFLAPDVTADMTRFLAAYQAMYHEDATGLVAPGWDAMMVLAQAIEKAGSTDGAAMAKAMEEMEFSLLTGKLRWSPAAEGHVPDIEAALLKLEHGTPSFIGWVHPSDIPTP